MERLTKPLCGGYELPMIPVEIKTQDDLQKFHEVRKFYESCAIRCGQYEDTGLEPEEINGLKLKLESSEMSLRVACDALEKFTNAEQDGRLLELPFVAMVEQSLQDGKMKPLGDQKHNGRYAVVYVDRNKWKSPLIDICGKPYNREEAEARMAMLAQKGGESDA